MEFKDFSLFIEHTKVSKFADYLGEGKIMATKCKNCGCEYYPPRADCSKCMSSDVEWFELGGKGKLHAFTCINVPPAHFDVHFENLTPPFSKSKYIGCPVGYLEMENGLKVMGWIPKISLKEMKVGMELKPVAQTLPDGKVTVCFVAA